MLILSRDKLALFELVLDRILPEKFFSNLNIKNRINMEKMLTHAKLNQISNHRFDLVGTEINLFRKESFSIDKQMANIYCIQIEQDDGFDFNTWIEPLKTMIKERLIDEEKENSRLWIITHCPISGILGFANCLRQEPYIGNKVRFIFGINSYINNDRAVASENGSITHSIKHSNFDINSELIQNIMAKDLAINVCQNGHWGSYRFIRLNDEKQTISTEYAYLSQIKRGDLSSLQWFESEHFCWQDIISPLTNGKELLCDVYYSALNFKASSIILILKI